MGIDVSSCLLVGSTYKELPEELKESIECPYDWVEEHGLSLASPYYDAPTEHMSIGYDVPYCKMGDLDTWVGKVKEDAELFKKLTGVEAILFNTSDVY